MFSVCTISWLIKKLRLMRLKKEPIRRSLMRQMIKRLLKRKEGTLFQKVVLRRNASIIKRLEGANLESLANTSTLEGKKGKQRLKRLS